MNIKEDYVSFETAKLLKEKGFNEPCLKEYYNNGVLSDITIEAKYNTIANQISAPTIQMVMKWFRIEHGIHIEPHIVKTKHSYGYMPNYVDLKELKQHFPFDEIDFSNTDKYVCITYDKACEVTIKYCLENII